MTTSRILTNVFKNKTIAEDLNMNSNRALDHLDYINRQMMFRDVPVSVKSGNWEEFAFEDYNALTKTKSSFLDRVKSIFTKSIDHTEKIDLIEEILLTSDVGIYTTEIVLAHLNSLHKSNVDIDLINESKSFLFDLLNNKQEQGEK